MLVKALEAKVYTYGLQETDFAGTTYYCFRNSLNMSDTWFSSSRSKPLRGYDFVQSPVPVFLLLLIQLNTALPVPSFN